MENWTIINSHGEGWGGAKAVNYIEEGETTIATIHIPLDGKRNAEIIVESEERANLMVAAPDMLKELQTRREELYKVHYDRGLHALNGDKELAKNGAEILVKSMDDLIKKVTQ